MDIISADINLGAKVSSALIMSDQIMSDKVLGLFLRMQMDVGIIKLTNSFNEKDEHS